MGVKVQVFGAAPTLEEVKKKLDASEMPEDDAKHFFPPWAYLAGILDGEGCIAIVAQKKNGKRDQHKMHCPRFRLRVTITSKDRAFLQRLKTIYGGFVTAKSKKTQADCSHLLFWDDKAGWILWNTFQYLIIKREEAKVAFQFLVHKHNTPSTGRVRLSQEVLLIRWRFKELLSALKGKASKA